MIYNIIYSSAKGDVPQRKRSGCRDVSTSYRNNRNFTI